MSTVDFPRYLPSALPCSWWRLDNTNLIPRSRNLVRCASISDLPSAATIWSSCKRRPRKQLLAEITLISGNICVTSWLLRSVKTSQSGTLFASVPTWSFDPGRAQPTGFGLVLGHPHSTYKRGVGLRVTWQAAVRAVDPTHLLFASRVSDANTSPGSRNPIRWVERANVTPCLIRTQCRAMRCSREPACDLVTSRVKSSAVAVPVRFFSINVSMIGSSATFVRRHDGQVLQHVENVYDPASLSKIKSKKAWLGRESNLLIGKLLEPRRTPDRGLPSFSCTATLYAMISYRISGTRSLTTVIVNRELAFSKH